MAFDNILLVDFVGYIDSVVHIAGAGDCSFAVDIVAVGARVVDAGVGAHVVDNVVCSIADVQTFDGSFFQS